MSFGCGQQPAADRQHLLLATRQHRSKTHPAARRGSESARRFRRSRHRPRATSLRANAPISRFSCTVRLVTMRRPSGTSTRCCRTRRLGRPAGDVGAVQRDRAFRRRLQPHERLEQRRLARAVGAEHRHDLALFDRQRNAAHRVDAAIANVKIVDLKTHDAAPRRRCRDRLRGPARSSRTCSGEPSAILRPKLSTITSRAQCADEMHVVLDHQQGDAAVAADRGDALAQRVGLGGVEAGRRLVEQQKPRLAPSARAQARSASASRRADCRRSRARMRASPASSSAARASSRQRLPGTRLTG